MLVRPKFEAKPPAQQTGALHTELTRRQFRWKNLCVKLWKWNEGQTNASVEGAAYCVKKNVCGKTLIKQGRFTQNRKKNKDLWYQVKKHIFYMYVPSLSCVEYVVASPLKSSITNRRFKRTQFAQEIRKEPKMKKKTISVTVTYLLTSKTGSSESQSWRSRRSDSVAWRAFSIPGSFVGKQGDLRGEREI